MSRLDETVIAFQNPVDQLDKGIEYCRKGDWETGFAHLSAVASQQKKAGELPSRYYSYLGYGMALREKRIAEGIKLCRFAIKQEFYQPENYVNLARTCLLANRRGDAYKAVRRGLKVDPRFPELRELHAKLGVRKRPLLPFFSRNNLFNQLFGRIRHALRGKPDKQAGTKKEGGTKKPATARRPVPRQARAPQGR